MVQRRLHHVVLFAYFERPDQKAVAATMGLSRPAVVIVAAPSTQPAEYGVVAAPRFNTLDPGRKD